MLRLLGEWGQVQAFWLKWNDAAPGSVLRAFGPAFRGTHAGVFGAASFGAFVVSVPWRVDLTLRTRAEGPEFSSPVMYRVLLLSGCSCALAHRGAVLFLLVLVASHY